jgi:hypothetical protein
MVDAVRAKHPANAALAPMWQEIAGDLERRRQALAAEIRDYPTPIPRCDAQFNHLYEQQVRLARDRERWGALAADGNYAKIVAEFIRSAPYTDDAEEKRLRERLGK